MPEVKNSVFIQAAPAAVYAVAREVELFPDFMPEVTRITVLERDDDGRRQVVEWVGVIPTFKLTVKWTEEDLWDDAELTCRFRQVRGDFNEYSGLWQFLPEGDGCRFESEVQYELEIPTVGPLIKGIVRKIMSDNVNRLQAAIKKRVESSHHGATETRREI
jgi:ribosome-associated toxin RatA of RatAB toxin-antitoxin module